MRTSEEIYKEILRNPEFLKKFRAHMRNSKWIYDHEEELRRLYPDEYVGADRCKIIDHDKDIRELEKRLEDKYGKINHIGIGFIPKERYKLLFLNKRIHRILD